MNRRLLWSLLLALLLPLAQVAAAAHELSHVQAASNAGSKSAPAAAHCDLCAVAASISGGGTPSTAPTLAPVHTEAVQPASRVPAAHFAQPFSAFASRAPPVLP
jgi:imidazolonepropionase-like amidohydrolase